MKKTSLFLAALCCVVMSPLSAANACEAPDWKICGTQNGCAKGCSDKAAGDLVSLEVVGMTAAELGRMLSDFSGTAITFGVADPNELFSLEVKNMPFGKLLEELAAYGAVAERSASKTPPATEIPEANITMKLEGVAASELAKMFEVFLSGTGFALKASDPGLLVSLEVKNMPLRDLIPILASTASVRLRSV